jgi:hypothetical protein
VVLELFLVRGKIDAEMRIFPVLGPECGKKPCYWRKKPVAARKNEQKESSQKGTS